ncbi:glycosyltransferase [Massilia sp. TS11]|uniref:glycosyltransferase n=1 Tax=Massilia sp. TS11 TaxID=2908003 RepID=UPI001EDB2312|nr:glycosyltransferase [Massilia sp. TS11]MCG2584607.1 glycosyltransferase [Massilia sp. TS11]
MKVLFIHQNFPAQFVHWAGHLARDSANTVLALSHHDAPAPVGVRRLAYGPLPNGRHPLEQQLAHAEACASAALRLRAEGFSPDAVVVHSGWGEGLFIKDVFPKARLVVYGEFYYDPDGPDCGFDPEGPVFDFRRRAALRLRNTLTLQQLELADLPLAPTAWQRSGFPAWVQAKMQVLHDGIDYARLQPAPGLKLQLAPQLPALAHGDEILWFAARDLEPVRGFHVLMRLLPALLRRRPQLQVVITGGDGNSYSFAAPHGQSWKAAMLAEVGAALDPARVHFTGTLPYRTYAALTQICKVRAYWTTPFVLSWSFLESAAAGVPLVASDTGPVREFAQEFGVQLCGFFDQAAWLDALEAALAAPARARRPVPLERIDTAWVCPHLAELLRA